MQEFLQHLFGFIGICTVLAWITKLYGIKQKSTTTSEDAQEVHSKNQCPKCDSPLSLMRGSFTKECTSCDYKEDWKLSKGQLPLVANNRMVKRDERNRR